MSDLPTPRSNDSAPDGPRSIPARRRILKLGATTAPVMLTLLSRPVLGATCMTNSAVGSTITSLTHQVSTCSGLTVSTWSAPATTWPDPYKKTTRNGINGWDATLYHCATTGLSGTTYPGKTMLDVLKLADGTGVTSLGRYIGAALLNARSGKTPVLSEMTIRNMWNAIVAGPGFYEPTAGVKWSPAEIIAYIKTTMG